MQIVINRLRGGGFDLSQEAFRRLIKKGWSVGPLPEKDEDFENVPYRLFLIDGEYDFAEPDLSVMYLRCDPDLVSVIKEFGNLANGENSQLHIVEAPDDAELQIVELDGMEWVVDKQRMWPELKRIMG